MTKVSSLQTLFAGNDNDLGGYAETHPIGGEVLGRAMHDMFIATSKVGQPGMPAISSHSLTASFFRNQDGGGYREMQPICEIGHAAAMTEMHVTTVRARVASQAEELKAEIA